jgi:GldM C-terminal domain
MNKVFSSIIFLCLTSPSRAQMVIATRSDDILYLGIANHLYIAVNKEDTRSLTFQSNSGQLTKVSSTEFIWRDCDTVQRVVEIYCLKGKKLLAKHRFLSKNIPDPTVSLDIGKSDFSPGDDRPRHINFYMKDWYFDHNYSIVSYFLQIVPVGKDTIRLENNNLHFNQSTISAVADLKAGDKIRVENLLVQDSCTYRYRYVSGSQYFVIK